MDSSYSIVLGFAHKINLLKNKKSGYETTSNRPEKAGVFREINVPLV